MNVSIVIAGPAGSGLNTVTDIITTIVKNRGNHIFVCKDYMSRVRGGFNFTRIRISDSPLVTFDIKLDALICLDGQGLYMAGNLRDDGLLITAEEYKKEQLVNAFYIDSKYTFKVFGKNGFAMASVGALLKLLSIEKDTLTKFEYDKWSDKVKENNIQSMLYGYSIVSDNRTIKFDIPIQDSSKRIMISGNQAVALGAIAAGLDFYSAYPMAPSTGILTYLKKQSKKAGIIVEQAEDEIAAVNAAIGASIVGARAMTGSSGGGLSLMVEALGFAAVGEIPLVLVDVQRPGPATGLPTRTEQGDLSFVLSASQGEFGRMIIAPRSIEDAFYQSFRAFNMADRYRLPVVILSDQYLADSKGTVERFSTSKLSIERNFASDLQGYKHYDYETDVFSRVYPGYDKECLIMTDSHIHDEMGHITEDPEMTVRLKRKLMGKEALLKKDLLEPMYLGVDEPEILLICWGSTFGSVRAAVNELISNGQSVGMLSFSDLYPLPVEKLKFYCKIAKTVVNIEQNYSNQFGKLLVLEGGVRYNHAINRYDGRPLSKEDVLEGLGVII